MGSTEALSDLLFEFENAVTDSIRIELQRIGRSVNIGELPCIPFNRPIRRYASAMRLNNEQEPIIDTIFSVGENQYLTAFISDDVISHQKMITLLGMLQKIES